MPTRASSRRTCDASLQAASSAYAVSAAAGTDKPYATGDFDFKVHWRQTPVAVDLGAGKAKGTLVVTVTNEWGDMAAQSVTCA